MNSFQIFFTFAVVAVGTSIAHDIGHSYEVKVQHDHYPTHHHEAEHGGEAYGHAEAYDSHAHHGEVSHDSGDHGHGHGDESADFHSHPQYKFEYGVKDPKTKDHHSQWEHRDGDKVVGEYSLDEADGTKRVVEYSSDKHSGFNAVVKKIGHAHHDHGHQH